MLALAWMALNANSEHANMLMFTIANCFFFWGGGLAFKHVYFFINTTHSRVC